MSPPWDTQGGFFWESWNGSAALPLSSAGEKQQSPGNHFTQLGLKIPKFQFVTAVPDALWITGWGFFPLDLSLQQSPAQDHEVLRTPKSCLQEVHDPQTEATIS